MLKPQKESISLSAVMDRLSSGRTLLSALADPAAPAALLAYADAAEKLGYNAGYVAGIRRLAGEFEEYRVVHGPGDPDRGRHRKDDPATIAEMKKGRSV